MLYVDGPMQMVVTFRPMLSICSSKAWKAKLINGILRAFSFEALAEAISSSVNTFFLKVASSGNCNDGGFPALAANKKKIVAFGGLLLCAVVLG